MLRVVLFFVFLIALSPAQFASAATVPLKITFTAEKTRHKCRSLFGGALQPGDDCGYFSLLEMGRTYSGVITFDAVEQQSDGSFLFDQSTRVGCTIGPVSCIFGRLHLRAAVGVVGPDRFSFFSGGGSYGGEGSFLFATGGGNFGYDDDSFPDYSSVTLTFSNAKLVGPPAVPLPGGFALLAGALLLGAGMKLGIGRRSDT